MISFSAVPLFSSILGSVPLSIGMHITAYVLAVMGLAVNIAIKKIPLIHFKKVFDYVDLETEQDELLLNQMMSKSALFIA